MKIHDQNKWKVKKLGDFCRVESGGTPSRSRSEYYRGDIPWITTVALRSLYVDRDSANEFITPEAVEASATKIINEGSILFGSRVGVGKISIAKCRIAINQDILGITVLDKGFYSEYLYRFLQSKNLYFNHFKRGATIQGITSEVLKNIKVPLPPLDIQQKIADVLGQAQALIDKRKEQIAALDELIKSVFLDMFGDLALNRKMWKETSLVECCQNEKDIKCGPFGTQLNKSEYKTEGVPLWGIPQINSRFRIQPNDYISLEKACILEQYSIEPCDIVMSRKGNVGQCALYPKAFPKGIMHSDVLRIRSDQSRINPVFVCHQLRYSRKVEEQIASVSSGAVMAGINVGKLKSIRLNIPPLNLQNQFAEIVEETERQKEQMQKSLAEMELLFNSLMQKAFRGELFS
ncbi:MAG: restriction endonuclease subunit S [Candidatus Saccharibacteria bacterium]